VDTGNQGIEVFVVLCFEVLQHGITELIDVSLRGLISHADGMAKGVRTRCDSNEQWKPDQGPHRAYQPDPGADPIEDGEQEARAAAEAFATARRQCCGLQFIAVQAVEAEPRLEGFWILRDLPDG
jgi:hypothetical protein